MAVKKKKNEQTKEIETYLFLLTASWLEYPATPPFATTSFKDMVQ